MKNNYIKINGKEINLDNVNRLKVEINEANQYHSFLIYLESSEEEKCYAWSIPFNLLEIPKEYLDDNKFVNMFKNKIFLEMCNYLSPAYRKMLDDGEGDPIISVSIIKRFNGLAKFLVREIEYKRKKEIK